MPNGLMNVSEGRHCLTARSKCHLALGSHAAALVDANASLEEDENFIKGILAKAEALYMKGDFEFALVFYHRGNKLRSELEEFKLGISKATEGINNAIGPAGRVELESTGDMEMFTQGNARWAKQKSKARGGKKRAFKPKPPPKASDRSVKALLGELYEDKQFLEKLMQDPSFVSAGAAPVDDDDDEKRRPPAVKELLSAGQEYLTDRTSFWRQQKPIYARVNERKARNQRSDVMFSSTGGSRKGESQAERVREKLAVAEEELEDGNADRARMMCENLVSTIGDIDVPRKAKLQLLASVYSVLGNAQLDLEALNDAENSQLFDLRYVPAPLNRVT